MHATEMPKVDHMKLSKMVVLATQDSALVEPEQCVNVKCGIVSNLVVFSIYERCKVEKRQNPQR